MAILKAALVSFANEALEESIGTDGLDEAIKLCLADLSEDNLLIGTDTSQALAADDETLAYPTGFKSLLNITLTPDGSDANEPLLKLKGGIKEYRELIAEATANGEPTHFAEFNELFYLWRNANGVYASLIEYYKYHADDADNIAFGDEFKNALKFGSTLFYALMKGRKRYMDIYGPLYGDQKDKRSLNTRKQPYITR